MSYKSIGSWQWLALWRQLATLSPLIFVPFRWSVCTVSLQVLFDTHNMLWVALLSSFLRLCQLVEARYLSINYICKLEYYYVLQVYWELAVTGVANWRQSARVCHRTSFARQKWRYDRYAWDFSRSNPAYVILMIPIKLSHWLCLFVAPADWIILRCWACFIFTYFMLSSHSQYIWHFFLQDQLLPSNNKSDEDLLLANPSNE